MDKKVNAYIKSIVNKANFNMQQKKDLEEYLKCSFEEDYNNYLSQNIPSELALNKALDKLGTPSEFSYELEDNNINKVNKSIQFISIAGLTLSLLAMILANNNHATFVDVLPYKFYESFLNFFNINIYYKISEIIKLEQIFNVFSMTIFFIPIGFFLPLATNKINIGRYTIYSYILLTCIFEFSKIFMIANPRLIYIILNFLACLVGYSILKIFTIIFFKIKNK